MSTQKNNNDTKKAAGYFKEKFTIGLSRVTGDEVTRAIMKTTSHMLKAPNEKHLQRLLSATHGHFSENAAKEGNMCRFIVEELEKRSHTHNWIVVLKTMLTFHAFLIDGSDDVNKVMQRNRNLFCGRSIKDLADSPDGAAQQRFITAYTRYLEERNITQMRIDLEVRIESSEYLSALKMMPMGVLVQALTQLLQQLECIAVVEFREEIINNFATLEAHTRLINDGAHLYAFISDRMVYALEHFEEIDSRASKEAWVVVYKRYNTCIHHIKILFDAMRRSRVAWGSIVIPEIKEFPPALLAKLEENLASGGSGAAAATAATSEVPEAEDLSAVLQNESEALPATTINRVNADEGAQSVNSPPTTAASPATSPGVPKPAEVNLFGDDNSQFNQPQAAAVAPPPVKPKLADLDDLFGGPAATTGGLSHNNNNANQWGSTSAASQPQQQNNANFDVFAAPTQPAQPQWGGTHATNTQFGHASSSGSGATPTTFGAAPASNGVDLFGNPSPNAAPTYTSPHQQQQQPVSFRNQTATSEIFGSDFAPINNNSTIAPRSTSPPPTAADPTRFDPFGQPPRENVFTSHNAAGSTSANPYGAGAGMFGANSGSYQQQAPQQPQQRPKNDMDDLFS